MQSRTQKKKRALALSIPSRMQVNPSGQSLALATAPSITDMTLAALRAVKL